MERLREQLDQLHAELARTQSVDSEAREALQSVMRDVQDLLERSGEGADEEPSLLDRLEEAARDFEESHPNLSAALGRVMNALSNMGI